MVVSAWVAVCAALAGGMSRADARAAAPAGPDEVASARASPGGAPDDANDYQSQLAVVRALGASGASADRVRAAAARLRELKREAPAAAPRAPRGDARSARRCTRARATPTRTPPPPPPRATPRPPPITRPAIHHPGRPRLRPRLRRPIPRARATTTRPRAATPPTTPPPPAPPPSAAAASTAAASSAQSPPRRHSWSSFFRRYGFVVFRDALTPDERAAARDEIWTQIERAHAHRPVPVRRDRPRRTAPCRPRRTACARTRGVFPRASVIDKTCARWRASRRLCLDDPRDALVSRTGGACTGPRGTSRWRRETRDFPEWKTRGNLHLDLNPWTWARRATRSTTPTDCPSTVSAISARRPTPCAPPRTPRAGRARAVGQLRTRRRDGFSSGFHATFDEWSAALGPKDA